MPTDPPDELLDCPAFADEYPPPEPFLRAAAACLDVLRERFPRYAEFLDRRAGREVRGPFASLADLDRLPALFLPVLKSYQFPLPPGLAVVQRLTGSGTTGQPSVTPLDARSWDRRVRAMLASYQALDLLGGE